MNAFPSVFGGKGSRERLGFTVLLYGVNELGIRTEATPGAQGACPGCGVALVAKCGTVNRWHWAHKTKDCDPWHEPEGAWHLGWKSMAPKEWTEVSMGPHRADIRRDDGLVIELQASAISAEEIAEREAFYGEMVWLLDGRSFSFNIHGPVEACCPCEKEDVVWYSEPPWEDGGWYTRKKSRCEKGKHAHYLDSQEDAVGWRLVEKKEGHFYARRTNEEESLAVWKHRKRSFDRAAAPVYIDLGENGVFEILEAERLRETWGTPRWCRLYRFDRRNILGFCHSRQEFAAAAGLTWRADALGD